MKRIFLAIGVAALVAGCGTPMQNKPMPVEDKPATPVMSSAEPSALNVAPAAKSNVAPVNLVPATQSQTAPQGSRLVYFDFDSFEIKPEFTGVIDSQARFIKASKAQKVVVEGHADERGGREYNLALGQKRSEAVRRSLALLGVAEAQLEAVSFGKEKPVDPGHDEAAWAKNRRAEVTYR